MQAVIDVLLKHLDDLLTGLVPIIIAVVALRLKAGQQVADATREVEREGNGLPGSVKHEMARSKLSSTAVGKAAFLVTNMDRAIKQEVSKQKRASMVPQEPKK